MSWSVYSKGTPAEVKAELVQKFELAKQNTVSVPVEQKSVELAEQTANLLVDELISSGYVGVEVSGYGSGTPTKPEHNWKGCVSYSLIVNPLNHLG